MLHHDKTAPVDIGFCRIPLDRITNAPIKRIDDAGTNVIHPCKQPLRPMMLKRPC